MTLIASRRFEGQPFIAVDGIAGDWLNVTVTGSVIADTADAHIYLQASTDAGETWVTAGNYTLFMQQNSGSPTALNVNQWSAGAISGGTAKIGEWIDITFRLLDPNNPRRSRVHFEAKGIGVHNQNAFYRNENVGFLPVGMVNSIRIIPSAGHISGALSIEGERVFDAYPAEGVPFRVAAIGASLTAGNNGGWAGQLHDPLQERIPNAAVVIRDWARGTTHIRHGLWCFGNIAGCCPSVVIIDFAAADAHEPFGISLAESYDKTSELVDKCRCLGASVFLITGNPMKTLTTRPKLEQYVQQYREIAQRDGVGLIDSWVDWGSPQSISYQSNDGIHPLATEHVRISVPAIVNALA